MTADVLHRFLDDSSRLKQWSAKRAAQLAALTYLASKFDLGIVYSER